MKDYSGVRGFNYQPSYASITYESWRLFDPQIWELELRRGKDFFPGINTIRLWLDWTAYCQNPGGFLERLETAIGLVDRICGAKTIPCLFNRWHNHFLDAGGIYAEHMIPNWSWIDEGGGDKFLPYLRDIITRYRDDERILLWDYCNEPFSYNRPLEEMRDMEAAEYKWLKHIYETVKELGATQDVGLSTHSKYGVEGLRRVADIQDLFMIRPYLTDGVDNQSFREGWMALLDGYQELSAQHDKPLLCSECCWGSLDDDIRTGIIRAELSEFQRRGIGFIPHALHHSLVADLHDRQYGPVAHPGNLMFIGPDGLPRQGHLAFNDY